MLKEFKKDLAKAQVVEKRVLETLSSLGTEYKFEWVGDQPACYHKGDIKAIAPDGREIYIDVKNDSRIHETGNVLCEEENFFKECGYYSKGNMYSSYDILAVVSQAEQKIYFIDFPLLKTFYNKGTLEYKEHAAQISYFYLCPLGTIKRKGAYLGETAL